MITLEEHLYNTSINAPNKTALIINKKSYTYKELFENIWTIKLFLEKQYSVVKGDNIILAANKKSGFIFSYFAIHLIGAKVVPIDEKIEVDRLNYVLEETVPKLIIGLENKTNNINIVCFDKINDLEKSKIPNSVNFQKIEYESDIMFTTGTTGIPKGVILTNKNIIESANNINSFIGNNSDDIELLAMPISHSFGLARLRCVFLAGGSLVLLPSIVNMKRMFRMFDEHNITGFSMVPSAWFYIKKMTGKRLAHYSNKLNYVELGSAYMSAEEKGVLSEMLPKTRLCMHYGLTEASRSTFLEFNTEKSFLDTIGKPSPNVSVNIFDKDGNKMLSGKEGEICIKGNHVSKKYLNDFKSDYFYGDFFRTGDIGLFNSKGYLIYKGRLNEIINVGGKNVSPIEVENKIKEFDNEIEVVCVGVSDKNGVMGEVIKAFIVSSKSNTVDFEKLDFHLRNNLENHKIPVEYESITEIPKTSSGKIQRQKLK